LKDDLRIDRSIYTAYNSIVASGLIYTGLIVRKSDITEKGIWLAEKLYKKRFGEVLYRKEDLGGLLEDYSFLISALIDSYTASLEHIHLDRAMEVMRCAIREFYKNEKFVEKDGVVTVYDLSYRSPLSQMISNLNALGALKDDRLLKLSESLLKRYAGMDHGLFDAGYLLALQSYLSPVIIEGDREMLGRFARYISHDVYLKEGEEAICIGTKCMKVSEGEMHKILEKKMQR